MGKKNKKDKPDKLDKTVKQMIPSEVYTTFKRFPRNLITKYKLKKHAHKRYLIRMRLRNGDETYFYAFPNEAIFKWQKGAYIIDDTLARYNYAGNIYALSYHEDFSLPIRVDYDINKLKDMVSDPAVSDMRVSLNPKTLEDYTESKVVQNMMTGAGIPELIKRVLLITVISGLISAAVLLLVLNESGILGGVI